MYILVCLLPPSLLGLATEPVPSGNLAASPPRGIKEMKHSLQQERPSLPEVDMPGPAEVCPWVPRAMSVLSSTGSLGWGHAGLLPSGHASLEPDLPIRICCGLEQVCRD